MTEKEIRDRLKIYVVEHGSKTTGTIYKLIGLSPHVTRMVLMGKKARLTTLIRLEMFFKAMDAKKALEDEKKTLE